VALMAAAHRLLPQLGPNWSASTRVGNCPTCRSSCVDPLILFVGICRVADLRSGRTTFVGPRSGGG
jgi:hypothetical protein